jgi:hypothetical protein
MYLVNKDKYILYMYISIYYNLFLKQIYVFTLSFMCLPGYVIYMFTLLYHLCVYLFMSFMHLSCYIIYVYHQYSVGSHPAL